MHILYSKRRRSGTVGEEEHAYSSEDLVLWVKSPVKKNPENEMPFILMVSLNLCLQTFGFLFAYS